ncbi:hypothetical protein AB3R30_18790 [Leptolyngbyaceae cyanobacterium UHCC 1019]
MRVKTLTYSASRGSTKERIEVSVELGVKESPERAVEELRCWVADQLAGNPAERESDVNFWADEEHY